MPAVSGPVVRTQLKRKSKIDALIRLTTKKPRNEDSDDDQSEFQDFSADDSSPATDYDELMTYSDDD